MLRPIVATCMLLALASSASASTTMALDASFTADLRTLTLAVTATGTGDDAKDLREAIDGTGNDDGTVSAAEVTAFVNSFSGGLAGPIEDSFKETITFDAKAPTEVAAQDVAITGAEGSVTSTNAITMRLSIVASFQPGTASKHILVLKSSEDDSSSDDNMSGEVTFHAPTGYEFGEVTGMPGNHVSSDGKKLTWDSNGETGEDSSITFVPVSSSKGSPAAGLLVGVLILGLAAVVRRQA